MSETLLYSMVASVATITLNRPRVMNALERPLETQLDAEAQAFARCARTADLAEGVSAFAQNRSPRFRGE